MPELTFETIAEMIDGELIAGGDVRASTVVIDSREARSGSVFFALRGERLDGHNYVANALVRSAGAVVEVVPEPMPQGKALVRVPDTTVALQTLAKAVRQRCDFTLIAVTGSAGKTTTKEMIATLVASERKTWKSWGNFNNQIGFPLCLANTPDGTAVVVSEMGMNHKGEIASMAGPSRPDVAVYTNIGPVHLEFFDSIDGIAEAKRELLEHTHEDGLVIANADDARVMRISEGFSGRRVTYGFAESADYRATEVRERGLLGSTFVLEAEGISHTIETTIPGRHNLENLLAALATARGIAISWDGILRAIGEIKPAYHRGVLVKWRGAMLYDDTYNSNPYALSKALELLSRADASGRRIAVIGDMLELGGDELTFHEDAGRAIPRNVDVVLGVGPRSKSLLRGAQQAGFDPASLHHFADAAEATAFLRDFLADNDLVLLKASRGIGLDRIVTSLESEG